MYLEISIHSLTFFKKEEKAIEKLNQGGGGNPENQIVHTAHFQKICSVISNIRQELIELKDFIKVLMRNLCQGLSKHRDRIH